MLNVLTNPSTLVIAEVALALSWYRMSKSEVNFVLLGASLGLKSQGYIDPNLELAIATGKPELFLGKEVGYEQEHCEATNQSLSDTGYGGDQE